jgi:triosephosphate isomerase
MRRPVIAGNWKMHKTISEAVSFAQTLKPLVVSATHCEVVVAPPFTALAAVFSRTEGSNIMLAAQDVAAERESGPYTGEVSAEMLRDTGARFGIIGHSERRERYGESDDSVNAKIRAAVSAGLTPIVCVGERLEERDSGRAEGIVGAQLARGMQNLTASEASHIMIAYEPVWAIGTGRTATPETAEEMHGFIRSRFKEMFGDGLAEGVRVLYGGSVKPDNISALMEQPDIDGALVGGASLEPETFARIVNYRR